MLSISRDGHGTGIAHLVTPGNAWSYLVMPDQTQDHTLRRVLLDPNPWVVSGVTGQRCWDEPHRIHIHLTQTQSSFHQSHFWFSISKTTELWRWPTLSSHTIHPLGPLNSANFIIRMTTCSWKDITRLDQMSALASMCSLKKISTLAKTLWQFVCPGIPSSPSVRPWGDDRLVELNFFICFQ